MRGFPRHPSSIYDWATEALIDAFLSRGWDINTKGRGVRPEYRLIDDLVKQRNGKEDLARWLIDERSAAINAGRNEPNERDPPPILEICAAFGSLSMFQFLEVRGAYFSPRILHEAAEMAADVGVDPSEDNCPRASDADSKCRRTRAELLVYLIDERGLDVNAMDEYVPPPKMVSHTVCYSDILRGLLSQRCARRAMVTQPKCRSDFKRRGY
ncbi:hypothetical protein F5X98DRAFT_357100 [Xylaria grammica]|nr:hypothetical protein F5X98DRAFT_357100 [Xylaria grammica]